MTRLQIYNRVWYNVNKANRLWEVGLKMPRIVYYTRGSVAGWAKCEENILGFNERIANLNGKEFRFIVIHEVAHLVTYSLWSDIRRHHSKEFIIIDKALGGKGFVYHTLKTTKD